MNKSTQRTFSLLLLANLILLWLLISTAAFAGDPLHFSPATEGDPSLRMNLWVVKGTVNGVDLVAGDEIGIFDGDLCVGAGVLTAPPSSENVLTVMSLIKDGDKPGFTVGHSIDFRLWDASEGIEITDIQPQFLDLNNNQIDPVVFEALADYGVELTGTWVANTTPTVSQVSVSGTARVGNTLTGSYNYSDNEGDLESGSIVQWFKADSSSGLNAAPISGATLISYLTVLADLNKYLKFCVTPSDGVGSGSEACSVWNGPVNGVPEINIQGNGITIVDGDTTPTTTDHTSFGSTLAGTPVIRTYTVQNTGSGTLTLGANAVTLSGTGCTEFSVTAQPASSIAETVSGTFNVAYNPTNEGTDSCTVNIANDDSNENPYNFILQGMGTGTPAIILQGNGINILDGDTTPTTTDHTSFGSTPAGTPVTRTYTVQNTGTGTLTLGADAVTLSGASCTEFSVTAQPPTSVAPSSSSTFNMAYNPTNAGIDSCTVNIANDVYPAPDPLCIILGLDCTPDENVYRFAIQGTGTALPEIHLQGNGITINDGSLHAQPNNHTWFGGTKVSDGILSRTFVVENHGAGEFTLNGTVTIDGRHPGDFTVTKQPDLPIPPDGSTSFTIQFNPTAAGYRLAHVNLSSNDVDADTYDFTIKGRGIGSRVNNWAMDTDLSMADASFWGGGASDMSGYSVSSAGDVNGDGYDDLLVGAVWNGDGGTFTGKTYLVLGKAAVWAMDTALSLADASFQGENASDFSGHSVSSAGDVNGDGYDDLLIGAYGNDDGGSQAGQTYLILGKAMGWVVDTNLSMADASFLGEDPIDRSGSSVSSAGDVNGDGYDDLLIGAYWNDDGGTNAGQTYLFLGNAVGWDMDTDLSMADASFRGERAEDSSGRSVSSAGDVNGDGYDDLLIGADKGGDTGAGLTYLIFGKANGWAMDTDLSNSDASFWGEDALDYSGYSLSSAGDVNGDGYDDLLIGARYNDDGGGNAGQTYLVFGKVTGWSMDTELSMADASFRGENVDDVSGRSISSAGDVNGDGYDDLLIGAYGNDDGGSQAGQTYLILGKATGWAMDTDLSMADASFWGEDASSGSGYSVSSAGDVNGDGYDDLLIGAYRNNDGGSQAGQTYLILGGRSDNTQNCLSVVTVVSLSHTQNEVIRSETTFTTSGNVEVGSGSDVSYEAGTSITLAPGFHAASGSRFTARITPVNCAASRQSDDPVPLVKSMRTEEATVQDNTVLRNLVTPVPLMLSFNQLPLALIRHLTNLGVDDQALQDIQSDAAMEQIIFTTEYPLLQEDTNSLGDIYRYQVIEESLSLVSLGRNRGSANGASDQPRIDGRGETVVYRSSADNIGWENDTNGIADIFLYDMDAWASERISHTMQDSEAITPSAHPDLGGDPVTIIYDREDDNGEQGVYGTTPYGTTWRVDDGKCAAHHPVIRSDGRYIAYLCGEPGDSEECTLHFLDPENDYLISTACPSDEISSEYQLRFDDSDQGVNWMSSDGAVQAWSENPFGGE